jgi:hypothetical protein
MINHEPTPALVLAAQAAFAQRMTLLAATFGLDRPGPNWDTLPPEATALLLAEAAAAIGSLRLPVDPEPNDFFALLESHDAESWNALIGAIVGEV